MSQDVSRNGNSNGAAALIRQGRDNSSCVVFIDARVPGIDQLLGGLSDDAQVFRLDAAQDGVAQIEAALAGAAEVESIHVISHGASGTLFLGSAVLTAQNLHDYQGALSRIGSTLSAEGDILLYGCDVGAGAAGQDFIETLALYTGADVAASDDRTGAGALGGDWVFESSAGTIDSSVAVSVSAQENYGDTLAVTPLPWVLTELGYPLGSGEANANPHEIAILDVNGDGFLDFVTAGLLFPLEDRVIPIHIMVNDRHGGFTDQTSSILGSIPGTVHARGFVVADFNGDGRPDLFIADQGVDVIPMPGSPNVLLLSSGAHGMINATANLPTVRDYTHSTTGGDIDGDGDVDILVMNLNGGSADPYFLVNDGTGHFNQEFGRLPANVATPRTGSIGIASSLLFDANGDGKQDLFLGQAFGTASSRVLLSNGTGNFSQTAAILVPDGPWGLGGHAVSVASMDVNADGAADLIVDLEHGYQGHYIQILINDGSGQFTDQTTTRLPQSTVDDGRWIVHVNTADLNNDGYTDLIAVNGDYPPFFLNDGTGHFIRLPEILNYRGFGTPWYIKTFAFDANADGRTDVLGEVGNNGSGSERMWLFTNQDVGATQTGDATANGIMGGSSAETLSGLAGDDVLFGAAGSDTLDGGDGADYLNGGAGSDRLDGGAGDDVLTGGKGNDAMLGGAGVDTAVFSGAMGSYSMGTRDASLIVSGADGVDVLHGIENLRFDNGAAVAVAGLAPGATSVTLISITRGGVSSYEVAAPFSGTPIAGVRIDYEFLGAPSGEVAVGTDSNDFFNLLAGDDAAAGGAGNDILDGGIGSNFLNGNAGTDTFFLDGRGGTVTWSTITDWQAGEQLSVWGWNANSRVIVWRDDGAVGYKGITMHGDLNNDGTIDTSVTWTGKTQGELPTPGQYAEQQLLWFT